MDIARYQEEEAKVLLQQLDTLKAIKEARKLRKIDSMFLGTGPYRRELYTKHMQFFTAGGEHTPLSSCPLGCDGSPHRERLLLAGNRVGKTIAAGCEFVFHATGEYPDWWPGFRFEEPTLQWVVNDSNKNVRDVNQYELMGRWGQFGTGLLPYDSIRGTTTKANVPQALDSVLVRHASGGDSLILFKGYEQGYDAFTGSAVHVIWCDEEPDEQVYAECCVRTMTTKGLILLTFTPLQGTTEVVKGFLNSYNEARLKHENIDIHSQ